MAWGTTTPAAPQPPPAAQTPPPGTRGAAPRPRATLLRTALPLGLWRLRRMWGLALVTQLGIIAAVVVMLAVPLFSEVGLGGGLQGFLANSPNANTYLVQISVAQPSAALLNDLVQSAETLRTRELGAYHIADAAHVEINTQPLLYGAAESAANSTPEVSIAGEQAARLGGDLQLVRGRLPQPSAKALEVVVTQQAATRLNLTVGTTVPLPASPSLVVRVVGIVRPSTTLFPVAPDGSSQIDPRPQVSNSGQSGPLYFLLTSNEAILTYPYDWTQAGIVSGPKGGGCGPFAPNCEQPKLWQAWYLAPEDLSHLSGQDLTTIIDLSGDNRPDYAGQINQMLAANDSTATAAAGFAPDFTGALPMAVTDNFGDYIGFAFIEQWMVWLLLVDALGLIALGVAQMAGMLVERQEPLIALLRSRGASRGQVFGAFALQSLALCVVGLAAGALLALPAARLVSRALLPPDEQATLSLLDGAGALNFGLGAGIAAAIVVAIFLIAMLRATGRALALNILTARQEATRPERKPLWQRLYLDVAAALLALFGYGVFYLASLLEAAQGQSNGAGSNFLLVPLSYFAPAFLMVAGALLFLRVLPWLLWLAERLAARGRSAPRILGLAQLARGGRSTERIVLPLALAICFLLFVLGTNASFDGTVAATAALQTGADFSGRMLAAADPTPEGVAQRTAAYGAIAGVRSAAVGYRGATSTTRCDTSSNQCQIAGSNEVDIEAVDPAGFAATAIWPAEDTAQPFASLMDRLLASRDSAAAQGAVPVIINSAAAQTLSTHAGATFTLPVPATDGVTSSAGSANVPTTRFAVLAVVPLLPGLTGNGVLADYLSFVAVYNATGADAAIVAPNFVWLRTADDSAALASVRAAIAGGPLALGPLGGFQGTGPLASVGDRRATIANAHGDPSLPGALDLGAGAALLLALFIALIGAISAARDRRMSLALLRALGTEPRRVRRVVLWELGIVYAAALLAGIVLGAALVNITNGPLVGFLSAITLFNGNDNGSSTAPVRVVWPWPALALTLGGLALVCALATVLAARAAARPSLAALLRLSGE